MPCCAVHLRRPCGATVTPFARLVRRYDKEPFRPYRKLVSRLAFAVLPPQAYWVDAEPLRPFLLRSPSAVRWRTGDLRPV